MSEEREIYKKGEGPWKFRSERKRTLVLDPKDASKIVAESKDFIFEVDDHKTAQLLHDHGYEEWLPITADDEMEIEGIGLVKVGKLPPRLAKELIGKSRKLLATPMGAVKDMLTKTEPSPLGEPEDAPKGAFMCPFCEDTFDSQPGLNGHLAHCKAKKKAESE